MGRLPEQKSLPSSRGEGYGAKAASFALAFGGFALDVARGALHRPDGTEVVLRPKTTEVLRLLAENPDGLVSREELLNRIWPGVFVSDASLTQCIVEIRRALGPSGGSLLRTLSKRGYLRTVGRVGSDDTDRVGDAPATLERASERRSIILVPFVDLTGDQSVKYLAAEITEELTVAVSRMPEFFVTFGTRESEGRARESDIRKRGHELGQCYTLTGSVRRAGARMRTAVRLFETRNGVHVWADCFEGQPDEAFGLQDKFVSAVARALRIRAAETGPFGIRRPASLNAYCLSLAGVLRFSAEAAIRSYEAERALIKHEREPHAEAIAKRGLGICLAVAADSRCNAQRLEQSIALLREAVTSFEEEGDAWEIAYTRLYLALALSIAGGERREPLLLASQAQEIFAAVGDETLRRLADLIIRRMSDFTRDQTIEPQSIRRTNFLPDYA